MLPTLGQNPKEKEPKSISPATIQLPGPFVHPWPGIGAIGLSPDGKRLVATHSFGGNVRICLWDATTGKPMRQFHGSASRLVFSPDSKTVYMGNRIHYRTGSPFWYTAGGNVIAHEIGSDKPNKSTPAVTFALSPDGKRLAVVNLDPTDVRPRKDPTLKGYIPTRCILTMLYTYNWKQVPEFEETIVAPTALAFSPDGKTLAVGTMASGIELWDLKTLRKLPRLEGFKGGVFHLAFSPDSKTLAATYETYPFHSRTKPIVLWDWAAAKTRHVIDVHEGPISGIGFIDGGKQLVSASEDVSIRSWEVATGKEVRLIKHTWNALDISIPGDGKLLAAVGNLDNVVSRPRLLDLTTREEILPPQKEDAMKLPFEPETPYPDPYSYTGTREETLANGMTFVLEGEGPIVRLLDERRKEVRRFVPTLPPIGANKRGFAGFAVTRDGKLLATVGSAADLDDRVLHLWDVATGKHLRVLKTRDDCDHVFRFAPDGKTIAVAHWDGNVRLWDVASGELRQIFDCEGMVQTMGHLAFSKDGKRLAAGNREKTLTFIWNVPQMP